jgi:hypothetical protein
LKTTAILRLKLDRDLTRRSLVSVLAPDNRELPRGLELSVQAAGSEVLFDIVSPSSSTSLSTVLALLRDAALFQEVWLLSRRKDARGRRD